MPLTLDQVKDKATATSAQCFSADTPEVFIRKNAVWIRILRIGAPFTHGECSSFSQRLELHFDGYWVSPFDTTRSVSSKGQFFLEVSIHPHLLPGLSRRLWALVWLLFITMCLLAVMASINPRRAPWTLSLVRLTGATTAVVRTQSLLASATSWIGWGH